MPRIFMVVLCNAKQSTNKKVDKFWEEISQQFVNLVVTMNKLNERNLEYEQSKETW